MFVKKQGQQNRVRWYSIEELNNVYNVGKRDLQSTPYSFKSELLWGVLFCHASSFFNLTLDNVPKNLTRMHITSLSWIITVKML